MAASIVCPGLSRPMTIRKLVPVLSSRVSLPRISGSVPSGTMTSNACPTSGPEKSGGVTPTTVNGTPSSWSVRPMTSAEPPNPRSQKP